MLESVDSSSGAGPMALNIKNPKVELLAREVASQAEESLTQAVLHSLQERLERLKGRRSAPDLVDELMRISRRCSALDDLDSRDADEILGL
jgi:antitoxin VapB